MSTGLQWPLWHPPSNSTYNHTQSCQMEKKCRSFHSIFLRVLKKQNNASLAFQIIFIPTQATQIGAANRSLNPFPQAETARPATLLLILLPPHNASLQNTKHMQKNSPLQRSFNTSRGNLTECCMTTWSALHLLYIMLTWRMKSLIFIFTGGDEGPIKDEGA